MKKKKGITFKVMCEKIAEAKILKKKDGTYPTWKEIWEYSPHGELFMIAEWYKEALSILNG